MFWKECVATIQKNKKRIGAFWKERVAMFWKERIAKMAMATFRSYRSRGYFLIQTFHGSWRCM